MNREALKDFQQARPDLILTDWLMPGMNGIEVCRALKSSPEVGNIPMIVVTCKNGDNDRNQAS